MKLFIFSGELSGDAHGGRLLHVLKQQVSKIDVTGVPGPSLRSHGVHPVCYMEDFAVMGFSDVLRSLPRLRRQFKIIASHILDTKPELVIFIDSPSFSLRMAGHLRKKGFKGKIVQYICPMVWAWGKERIDFMAQTLDLLLTIYPFENQYFKNKSLKVEYVGNPVVENVNNYKYDGRWRELFGIQNNDSIIALFPGSRKAEIQRNLLPQLEAVRLYLQEKPDAKIAISCADPASLALIQNMTAKSTLNFQKNVYLIPKTYSYELMQSCQAAIAKSGTITLELALHQCPTVVMYQLTWLNWLIAKHYLKLNLPNYCIVNILSQKNVFPELIANRWSPEELFQKLFDLQEPSKRQQCILHCSELKTLLCGSNASVKAAKAILEIA